MRIVIRIVAVMLLSATGWQAAVSQIIGGKMLRLNDLTTPIPNYIALIPPPTLSGNTIFTLPPAAAAGVFKSNASAIMSISPVVPGDITLSDGSLLMGNSSNIATELSPGTSNQVLSINGSGDPAWQALSAIGGITGSGTATQVAYFDGTSSIASSSNLFWNNTAGSLGIGTGGAPDASAALEVSSTDGGMLIPRMDMTNRDGIASPATGLLIYQTDNGPGFYYYNGTAWVSLMPSSGGVGSFVFIRKTANQIIPTGAGFTNDNDFVLTIGANEIWEFEMVAFFVDNGLLGLTKDFNLNLSTAGMSGAMFAHANVAGTLGLANLNVLYSRNINLANGNNTMGLLAIVALTNDSQVLVKGFITGGAAGGTAQVSWRHSGLGNNFSVQTNSYLRATRVQ